MCSKYHIRLTEEPLWIRFFILALTRTQLLSLILHVEIKILRSFSFLFFKNFFLSIRCVICLLTYIYIYIYICERKLFSSLTLQLCKYKNFILMFYFIFLHYTQVPIRITQYINDIDNYAHSVL